LTALFISCEQQQR